MVELQKEFEGRRMSDKIPITARRIHCRDLDGDRTGILILRDEHVELYFVDYDGSFHLSADGPAYVVTEEGEVASLYANVPGRDSFKSVTTKFGSKVCGCESNKYRSVCQSGIISNITVIGANAWRPDDLVRRLAFDVAQTQRVLRHREKVRALGSASRPSDDDLALYHAEGGNMALTAGYAATYGGDTRSLTAYRPTFSIEFAVGSPLDEIEVYLVRYLSVLSFVLGGRVTPAAVRIDRLSSEDIVRAVQAGTYVGDHRVMWNWPTEEHDPRSLATSSSAPFLAEDDSELAALKVGLAEWVNRSDAWERAYVSMTECLRLRREASGSASLLRGAGSRICLPREPRGRSMTPLSSP